MHGEFWASSKHVAYNISLYIKIHVITWTTSQVVQPPSCIELSNHVGLLEPQNVQELCSKKQIDDPVKMVPSTERHPVHKKSQFAKANCQLRIQLSPKTHLGNLMTRFQNFTITASKTRTPVLGGNIIHVQISQLTTIYFIQQKHRQTL